MMSLMAPAETANNTPTVRNYTGNTILFEDGSILGVAQTSDGEAVKIPLIEWKKSKRVDGLAALPGVPIFSEPKPIAVRWLPTGDELLGVGGIVISMDVASAYEAVYNDGHPFNGECRVFCPAPFTTEGVCKGLIEVFVPNYR